MTATGPNLLSVLIFAPLVAAAIATALRSDRALRVWTLFATTALAATSLLLLGGFDASTHAFQFVTRADWIPSLRIQYFVGIDGISLLLVLLTTLIAPLCVLASWTYIQKRVKEFMIALLLMESAMVGVFCALDTVLFFTFWEAMLIPMSLMIGIWGGPRRIYAAVKFFIYTMAGSVLLLVAIVVMRVQTGGFGLPETMEHAYEQQTQKLLIGAFFLSFAIKVPMFPFHTWLPAAHVEAPTAGSVILASVLLKMGTYGFLRFCLPIAPYATHVLAPYILWLSVIAILYGGFAALAQGDMKKLVAYSSVAHMGFATLGIFALNLEGVEGATLIMINHGITTGALFIMVGIFYERLHTRELDRAAGLGRQMPIAAFFFGVFCLSSLAFPGTNSFVGEFLSLAGAYRVSIVLVLCAVPGVVAAAAYMYRVLQRFAYGSEENPDHSGVPDLNLREIITLTPLLVGVVWIGLNPAPLLRLMHASVVHLLEQASR